MTETVKVKEKKEQHVFTVFSPQHINYLILREAAMSREAIQQGRVAMET